MNENYNHNAVYVFFCLWQFSSRKVYSLHINLNFYLKSSDLDHDSAVSCELDLSRCRAWSCLLQQCLCSLRKMRDAEIPVSYSAGCCTDEPGCNGEDHHNMNRMRWRKNKVKNTDPDWLWNWSAISHKLLLIYDVLCELILRDHKPGFRKTWVYQLPTHLCLSLD